MADITNPQKATSIAEAYADSNAAKKINELLGGVKIEGADSIPSITERTEAVKARGVNVEALEEAVTSITQQNKALIDDVMKLAHDQAKTAVGGEVIEKLGEGSASDFYDDIAKRIERISDKAVNGEDKIKGLEGVWKKLKELADPKEEITQAKIDELTEHLTKASEKASEAAVNARLSIANEYLNEAAKKLKGDELKKATTALSEGFELEATFKKAGIEGIESAEAAAKYLRDATKGYFAGFGGMLKADGFGKTFKHIYNPAGAFAETKHAIGGAENVIGLGGHLKNTAITTAGVGLVGDALLRSKNSEGEDRSPGTRVVEAILGGAVAAAPVLKSVRI